YFLAWLSKRRGKSFSISVALFIWVNVWVYAYFLKETDLNVLYIVRASVGCVLCDIQVLSRTTYSRLLPGTKEHTSFFSFYDVVEKVSIVIGTLLWGVLEEITGDMRTGIVALGIFFIIGWSILVSVNSSKLAKLH